MKVHFRIISILLRELGERNKTYCQKDFLPSCHSYYYYQKQILLVPADDRLVREHFPRAVRRSPAAKALEQKKKKQNDYSLLNSSGKHRELPWRGICRSRLLGQCTEAVRRERFISRFKRVKKEKRGQKKRLGLENNNKMTTLTWYDRSLHTFFVWQEIQAGLRDGRARLRL